MAEIGPLVNQIQISIDGQDLSDHCRSINPQFSAEPQDDTVATDTYRSQAGGLLVHGGSAEFNADEAAGSVAATCFGALGTKVAITFSLDGGTTTYGGTGLITAFNPASGAVGNQAVSTVEWVAGDDDWQRT